MDYGRPDLADRLAAEYAAGLMRGAARRRLEALLPAHPLLRDAVRAWRDRLMPLTWSVDAVEPSPGLWRRIEAALDGRATPATLGAGAASTAPDTSAASPPLAGPEVRAANDARAKAAAGARGARAPGWFDRLAVWRFATAIAGVAALGVALKLAEPSPVQAPIVVVLAPAGPSAPEAASEGGLRTAGFVAGISPDGRALVTRPLQAGTPPPNHALELWSLPAAGAPRSLGLIAADRATVVERGRVLDGTTGFAVSLEPPGGSPTGAPTGPVLFVGKLGT